MSKETSLTSPTKVVVHQHNQAQMLVCLFGISNICSYLIELSGVANSLNKNVQQIVLGRLTLNVKHKQF